MLLLLYQADAFHGKVAHFYENHNALEHFKTVNRSTINQFFLILFMVELLKKNF